MKKNFDICGAMIVLSAGDLKRVEKLITELKKETSLYQAHLKIEKEIYALEFKMAHILTKDGKRLKEDTKINCERLVIFKNIHVEIEKTQMKMVEGIISDIIPRTSGLQ